MREAVATRACLVLLACATLSCGGESPREGSGSAPPAKDAAIAATPLAPSDHPPSVAGLESQLGDLIAAVQSENPEAATAHSRALALPEAQAWFRDRFGEAAGRKAAEEYEPIEVGIEQFGGILQKYLAEGMTVISAGKFEKVDDLDAVSYQTIALKAMLIADPLYSVRLSSTDKKRSFHLWSFVHAGGRFRFIGKLRSVGQPDRLGDLDLNDFRPTDAARLREANAGN